MIDPRIASLAAAAEVAANDWSPYHGVHVRTDRAGGAVLTINLKGPIHCPTGDDCHVNAYFGLAELDELLRSLLAARADLVKLQGGK